MAFENLTFFELHLHEESTDTTEAPFRSPDAEPESKSSLGRRVNIAKIGAMVGFSIGISVLATVVARKVAAKVKGRRSGDADEESEAVLEITG